MPNILACEGVSHPISTPLLPGPKARFLPAPLIRARAEAMNPRNCLDLNRTARQALYGILAFFNIRKPGEPVFASRENICAEALLGSQPTLYRALAYLVTKGYIRREQGRRYAKETYGQYSVSRIWLEDKALQLLGLASAQAQDDTQAAQEDGSARKKGKGVASPNADSPQGPSINSRGRLQENELSPRLQLSTKEQPPKLANAGNGEKRGGESSGKGIDPKTRLPVELLRLIDLGLSRGRICLLMKQAREHGNCGMLGAVVSLVWPQISKLRGVAVFAYLSKLVKQRKDYTRLLKIQDQYEDKNRMPQHLAERLSQKIPAFLERSKGMVLVNRAGKLLGSVTKHASGGFVEMYDERGVRRMMPVNPRLIEMWEEGEVILRQPA